MRKITAILFISLFAFMQYAKQALYLECKLSNSFSAPTEKCDCASQAGLDKKEEAPPSRTHNHFHVDELFPVLKLASWHFNTDEILIHHSIPHNEKEIEGIYRLPYHPPRT